MNLTDIILLSKAGFSASQIQAMAATEQAQAPAPAPAPAPVPAQVPAQVPTGAPIPPVYPTTPAQPAATAGGVDLAGTLQQILANQQRQNLAATLQPKQETSADIIASIINPPQQQTPQSMPDVSTLQNLNGILVNK